MTIFTIESTPTLPLSLNRITAETQRIGFNMASEPKVGMLLRCLAASKPKSKILEIGTGTGYGSTWILDGMDQNSVLDTVDINETAMAVAKSSLGYDKRINFHLEDGNEFLRRCKDNYYDIIFADSWPGKYENFHETLRIVRCGGFILFDDMLPQPNWPDGHEIKVEKLLGDIQKLKEFRCLNMDYGTGMILMAKSVV